MISPARPLPHSGNVQAEFGCRTESHPVIFLPSTRDIGGSRRDSTHL